jgi:diguanylate cyclase
VWYEHLAGINPNLSTALEQAKLEQQKLDAHTIARLHREHVAEPDASLTQEAGDQLRRLMQGVEVSAADTQARAFDYGSRLAEFSQSLGEERSGSDEVLTQRFSQVADGTVKMQAVVAAFEDRLREGRREVDRLRLALERARVEAITDPLSKLHNRKGFDDALKQTLLVHPNAGTQHHLILFDLDHFKRVNDSHGHGVGDIVIETVGRILARAAGESDDTHAARIGGEEFAVLMRSTTKEQALQLANSVRGLVRSTKIRKRGTDQAVVAVSVSAGIAAWVPGEDTNTLLAAADDALYRAKNSGRDQVIVATAG